MALIVGKVADQTPRTTLKRTGRFLRDDDEAEYLTVVFEARLNRFRMKQVLLPWSTATKKENTSRAENKKNDKENDHWKGEKHFDGKNAAALPSGSKERSPFHDNVSSKWMRNEEISVEYRDNNLEPHFTPVSAYFKAYILTKERRLSVFITAA